ncbi:MAG: hypothetical protein MUC99_11045, partial [Anaerolineae bacterium]|nr:hypothetical protein [Anaerolineae bacterium]
MRHWKTWKYEQQEDGKLPREFSAPWERSMTNREFLAQTDPLLEQAISIVVEEQEASASLLQRKLDLGYPRVGARRDAPESLTPPVGNPASAPPATGGRWRWSPARPARSRWL